jgi:hypothetical protein
MDFFDDHSSGGTVLEGADNGLPHHVAAAAPATLAAQLNIDGAVSQTIARAIRDATQTADPARQHEAASWLLICCPDIAEQVDLPDLHIDTMATLAAAYVAAAHGTMDMHTSIVFGPCS